MTRGVCALPTVFMASSLSPAAPAFDVALERAVREVLAAGKPQALNRNTGAPKIAAVRDLMSAAGVSAKALKKLTNDMVYDTFTAVTADSEPETGDEGDDETPDTTDLADEDGIDEPVGEGVKALLDESEEDESEE